MRNITDLAFSFMQIFKIKLSQLKNQYENFILSYFYKIVVCLYKIVLKFTNLAVQLNRGLPFQLMTSEVCVV